MNKVVLITATLLSLSFIACNDNDDQNNNSGDPNLGEISLTVSGEVEGNFSGMAGFHHLEAMGIESWEISGNNYNQQTFSIQFLNMAVGGGAGRPSLGTYSIGSAANADYTANFTHIPDGSFANSVEYSTAFGESSNIGTLNITSSNENTVKGGFEFTAYSVDDNLNIVGSIQITGAFSANKRIN